MLNIPNTITVLRLLAAIAIGMWPSAFWNAVLFVAASSTDWLDGVIARRWNQTTKLGAMLDPIADKALVLISLVALAVGPVGIALGGTFGVLATVIIFREVLIAGMREFLGDARDQIKVTTLAKWKTALQMTGIGLLFVSVSMYDLAELGRSEELSAKLSHWMLDIGTVVFALAAVLTVITAVDYWRKAWPLLKDE